MSISAGMEDMYHMPKRIMRMEEGEEEGDESQYWSRKPWKWSKKKRMGDNDEDYDDGREYSYGGNPGGYRAGPGRLPGGPGRMPGAPGRLPGRRYAGDEFDSEEDEDFGQEEAGGRLYDSADEDYDEYSDDSEDEFQDRAFESGEHYRPQYQARPGLRESTSSARRPSLYEPMKSGKDCPHSGIGSLMGANKEECKEACKTGRHEAVNQAHRSLVAKYARSRANDSTMSSRAAARMEPVSLKASACNEIVRSPNPVIVTSEAKFETLQRTAYHRSDEMIKAFKANAIEHMRGLLGVDFSRMTNPEVKKKGSALIIGDKFRMSPYILGSQGSASIQVTEARGFPSIKKNDTAVDSGFIVSVISKNPVTVHGKYGGKKGKPLTKGQTFCYGEIMVKTPRNVRKPEWFRAASLTPSMITDVNTSRAQMEIRRTSLFAPSASDAKTSQGQMTRVLKIERMTDSEGRDAKRVNSHYEINFSS